MFYAGATAKPDTDMLPHRYIVNFNISDLKSIRRSKPNLTWSYMSFIMHDGSTHPTLHFHQGGTKELLQALKTYLVVKK